RRGMAIEDRNAMLVLATGVETQKRAYMATLTDSAEKTISLHVQGAPSDPGAARLALTTILARKGRVLEATADSLAALRRHLTPGDQAVFDRLAAVKSEIGALLFRGAGKLSTEEYRKHIEDLEDEREKLDAEISRRSVAFRAALLVVTLEQVQAAIP